jgi:hypothetical protein
MVWLITGLVLALAGGLAALTRWGRRRPVADDTLIAELLGPPRAGRALPAPPVCQDAEPHLPRRQGPRPPWPQGLRGTATGCKPSSRGLAHGRCGCTHRSPPRQQARATGKPRLAGLPGVSPDHRRQPGRVTPAAWPITHPPGRPGPGLGGAPQPPPRAANASSSPNPARRDVPSTFTGRAHDLACSLNPPGSAGTSVADA